jgi:hypothetical protein
MVGRKEERYCDRGRMKNVEGKRRILNDLEE